MGIAATALPPRPQQSSRGQQAEHVVFARVTWHIGILKSSQGRREPTAPRANSSASQGRRTSLPREYFFMTG